MKLNSKFSEDVIYEEIIKSLNVGKLCAIIDDNLMLKNKYKNLSKANVDKSEKDLARELIIDSYKKIKKIKQIIEFECVERIRDIKDLKRYKSVDELKKYARKGLAQSDKLMFCVAMWNDEDTEKNELGNKVFKAYKENKLKKKDEEENDLHSEEKESNIKDIMSMNLSECIGAIVGYKEKVKFLEDKLLEIQENKKSKENINESKEVLDCNFKNDFKKEVKLLNKSILEQFEILKSENTLLNKNILELKRQNDEFKKELIKQNKIIEKISTKDNTKDFKKVLVESQNTIKGSLIEDNKKLLIEIKKYIKEEIDLSNKKIKEESDNIKLEFESQNNDLEVLLDEASLEIDINKEKIIISENEMNFFDSEEVSSIFD